MAADVYFQAKETQASINNMFPFVGVDTQGNSFSIGRSGYYIPGLRKFGIKIPIYDEHFIRYYDGPEAGGDLPISEDQYDELNDKFWDEYKKKYPTFMDRWRHQNKLIKEYEKSRKYQSYGPVLEA